MMVCVYEVSHFNFVCWHIEKLATRWVEADVGVQWNGVLGCLCRSVRLARVSSRHLDEQGCGARGCTTGDRRFRWSTCSKEPQRRVNDRWPRDVASIMARPQQVSRGQLN